VENRTVLGATKRQGAWLLAFLSLLSSGLRAVACETSLASSNLQLSVPPESQQLYEFRPATAFEFSQVLRERGNPLFLKLRDSTELQQILDAGGVLFLNERKNVGFGITAEHELISLFNASGVPGWGARALELAKTRGMKFLHCLEPLRAYYESFGFEIAHRYLAETSDRGRVAQWAALGRQFPDRLLMILK
jgi:hypothetical protein